MGYSGYRLIYCDKCGRRLGYYTYLGIHLNLVSSMICISCADKAPERAKHRI